MWFRYGALLLCCLLTAGCSMSMQELEQQLESSFSEQLYLDARLEFALSHPLDWQRLQTPVSSPGYRADRVRWQIMDSQKSVCGEMQVISLAADPNRLLLELLDSANPPQSEPLSGTIEHIDLPIGPALQRQAQFPEHNRLTTAVKGHGKDFIISFSYPANQAEQFRPVFAKILASFNDLSCPPDQNRP